MIDGASIRCVDTRILYNKGLLSVPDHSILGSPSATVKTTRLITKWRELKHSIFQHKTSLCRANNWFSLQGLTESASSSLLIHEERPAKLIVERLCKYRAVLDFGKRYEQEIRESIEIDVAALSLYESVEASD